MGVPTLVACSLALLLGTAAAAEASMVFREVDGDFHRVRVEVGETLTGLAAEEDVPWWAVAAVNHLGDPDHILAGQVLEVDTRHIVPALVEDGVVINIPEAALYCFADGELVARYPVGLGRPSWPTPTGSFQVLFRERHPTWNVPPSIQEELRRSGRVVIDKVPPGPGNPLGQYWIQLSAPGYGMHGTPFTASVGRFVSHGCIRLGPEDIRDLFGRVGKGTTVTIVYLPVKVALTATGRIWMESHPDVYRTGVPTAEEVWEVLRASHLANGVDEGALRDVLRENLGVARPVGSVPQRVVRSSGARPHAPFAGPLPSRYPRF